MPTYMSTNVRSEANPIPACINRQEAYLQIKMGESNEAGDRLINRRSISKKVDPQNVLGDDSPGQRCDGGSD